jgi:hypothetical protein
MKRDKWEFQYTAGELVEACVIKERHHSERLKWWTDKKSEVMEKIKAEGISVDESLADRDWNNEPARFSTASNAYVSREPTVRVRIDLQRDLNEAFHKIREHQEKLKAYQGWQEIFKSQQSSMATLLHYDDWLYFFGQTSQTPEW